MRADLAKLEQEALSLMNSGDIKQAAELFSRIIEQRPDYEHGQTLYNLAGCYEDLGQLDEAKRYYLRALEYGPHNEIILGGYASFLYLYGDPQQAFDAHLTLLRLERSNRNSQGAERTVIALKELAKRLGLTEYEVIEKTEFH
jgi:Tfp pilus assembly protein PilF